jgi:hypothetical protein
VVEKDDWRTMKIINPDLSRPEFYYFREPSGSHFTYCMSDCLKTPTHYFTAFQTSGSNKRVV